MNEEEKKKIYNCATDFVSRLGSFDVDEMIEITSDVYGNLVRDPHYEAKFTDMIKNTCEKRFGSKEFEERDLKTMKELSHSGTVLGDPMLNTMCINLMDPSRPHKMMKWEEFKNKYKKYED